MVAADGVHSFVSDQLFGQDEANFTGRIAYRTVFPAALLNGYEIGDCTKWWGPDRHIVIYYVKPDRSEVYFVTSQPEPGFTIESWSATGDVKEVARALRISTPRCATCWPPARRSTNGRCSTAIRRPLERGQYHPVG